MMLLNKTKARAKVRAFALQAEFDAAYRNGELPFRQKNPDLRHQTAEKQILLGDLIEWCERTQAAKLAIRPSHEGNWK